jgi:hypothetical protein
MRPTTKTFARPPTTAFARSAKGIMKPSGIAPIGETATWSVG